MHKLVGTERGLETKVKGLDLVRITLVTKSCSKVGDLNWLLSYCIPNFFFVLAKAVHGFKTRKGVFEKEKQILFLPS